MRRILIAAAITASLSGCMHCGRGPASAGCSGSALRTTRAPVDSVTMSIAKDGEPDERGMAKVGITFRNVSPRSIYFPVRFGGGVTDIREVMPEPALTVEPAEDGTIEIVEEEVSFPRAISQRGCGGQGGRTRDDFILLKPGATHAVTTTIDVSAATRPFILQLSRALYSSDVELPNMWLGNVASNELRYDAD